MAERIDPNQPNRAGKTIMDYLPAAMQKLGMGQRPKEEPVSIEEASRMMGAQAQGTLDKLQAPQKVIDKKAIDRAIATLKKYKDGKRNLESRIVEEERWWKLRHWDVIRGKASAAMQGEEERPEPTSAWMFNSIANKHADIMDNYPEPNVLPREMQDEQDADTLSAILPVVLERNEYDKTYSQAAWYFLKHGVCAKGTFWNQDLNDGLGDVDNRFMDILNVFWEPGITDIQDSRDLFVVSLKDNDLLEQEYQQLRNKLGGQIVDVQQYVHDDTVDVTDKSLVVDWYYKKRTPEGRTILHLCKFVGSEVLFASEDEVDADGNPAYPDGFYEHGRYPVELNVLFPEEGTPVGFGYIAIMKSPQLYIDKLSQVILEHSMQKAKIRYWVKDGAGFNEDEFLDWSKPFAHYTGDPDNIRPIEVPNLDGNVINAQQMKIDELKETSSNRDVSQGSTAGGVTAAAAIAALQEAGNKTSRDMIASLYRSYTQECYLSIELIRQFYDEERTFRITGETGQNEYIQFSNASIRPQPIGPAYPGQEMEPGYTEATRKPVFDIVVKPQKRSPYSKMAQNELAKEMYSMGMFNPQLADQTLAALDLMDFDGKEKVKDKVQQGQTLMQQVAKLEQLVRNMAMIAYQMTGQDILGMVGGGMQGGAQPAPAGAEVPRGGSMGKAQKAAQESTMTDYGQKLAARAKPDMEAQV